MGAMLNINGEQIDKEDIAGYECRFATYVRSSENFSDALVAKEYVHVRTKDGIRRIPRIRTFVDHPRDFWITKPGYRNHKDKKEWELESRLQKFTTTQIKMTGAIARALGMPGLKTSLRMLARSPYLYGADIHPSALLKKEFATKWPECVHPLASVAVGDIETDVVDGVEDIILITLSFRDRVFTAANRRWIGNIANVSEKAHAAFEKYLGDVKKERNINWEFMICDTPALCVEEFAKRAHEWKPDFLTFWNIAFDVPKILRALEMEGFDPKDVFSDPDVPSEFRYFKWREGKAQKVTQDGTVIPLHPAERWHTVEVPASFYFVDSMCLYCRIRIAAGKEPSYSLDAIMNKHVKRGKLHFTATDHIQNKLQWHQVMQTEYKIEYIIYNVFDCIGTELLDEKTKDLRTTFATLAGFSDYSNFNSNPRKLVDDLHFVYRARGGVIGTTSDDMKEELDKYTIDLNNHIVTLNTELMDYSEGCKIIEEMPGIETKIFCHNADLDVAATYPTEEVVYNISKETTWLEMSAIQGLPDEVRREVGINISGGVANAMEHCMTVHGLPSPEQMLALYMQKTAISTQ